MSIGFNSSVKFLKWQTTLSKKPFIKLDVCKIGSSLEILVRELSENGRGARFRIIFSSHQAFIVTPEEFNTGEVVKAHLSLGPTLLVEDSPVISQLVTEDRLFKAYHSDCTEAKHYVVVTEQKTFHIVSWSMPRVTKVK